MTENKDSYGGSSWEKDGAERRQKKKQKSKGGGG